MACALTDAYGLPESCTGFDGLPRLLDQRRLSVAIDEFADQRVIRIFMHRGRR